jgi:hypothetical protein
VRRLDIDLARLFAVVLTLWGYVVQKYVSKWHFYLGDTLNTNVLEILNKRANSVAV